MKTFQTIFMSFDGAIAHDSTHDNLEDATDAFDCGSKWFFYPFPFVVKGKTVVETGCGLFNMKTQEPYLPKMFKGKRLTTVQKEFKKANDLCEKEGIEVDSLEFEQILIENILRK